MPSGNTSSLMKSLTSSDLIVVGAGLFGLTIANLVSSKLGKKVTILETRPEIGGNAYAYFDKETGIEVHKYGSHLFHTSNKKVWDYVNQFTSFSNYRHHVFTRHNFDLYPMPINLTTINQIYGLRLNPVEAEELIELDSALYLNESATTFESKALRTIGSKLYESLIKGYTLKQWQTDPSELPGSVFSRLPIRFNLNHSYFDDEYQGLPSQGYQVMFNKMVSSPLVKIFCNVDYFDYADFIKGVEKTVVYTGPLDRYFEYQFGPLTWRTLDFEIEKLDVADYQGTSVINEADIDVPFTRTHEFKHLHPEWNYKSNQTIIMREFSRFANKNDEPYYPVNSSKDRDTLKLYRELAEMETNTFFGGRLGSYLYLDMHMAIASAFTLFENELVGKLE